MQDEKGQPVQTTVTIQRSNLRQDLRDLLVLEKLVFEKDAFPAHEFLYLYHVGSDTFLVARTENDLIGYISAYIEDDAGYIASIAVHPDHRGNGIGRTLLRVAMRLLEGNGDIVSIQLHVRQSNKPAITLYEKLGYRTTGIDTGYYNDGEAALIMTYTIQSK
ncbi:MAG: ribosomal protein S18-alanine N-acetyltransferase [Chloroflexota bacterium]